MTTEASRALYLERYRSGEWRAKIFRDMILEDMRARSRPPVVLDIGCGRGFEGSESIQKSIAEAAGHYVGVEPDADVPLGEHVQEGHRCLFEDAPIRPGSIDVAFAVMVLEHLDDPSRFWGRLLEVLAPGGVFWGFTMDARHPFCRMSQWTEALRIKSLYLTLLRGRRGVDRYENYPVRYLSNTPAQVAAQASGFASCEVLNFAKEGELDHYLPGLLRGVGRSLDRRRMASGRPGSLLAVRVAKGEVSP